MGQWPDARSARDLQLELGLLAGPAPEEAVAYRLQLPGPRAARLKDLRIGYVLSDPFCPPASEVAEVLSRAVEAIRKQGARLSEGWPPGVDLQRTADDWFFLAVNSWHQKEEDLRKRIDSLKGLDDYYSVRIVEALSALPVARGTARGWRTRAVWQDTSGARRVLMPVSFGRRFARPAQELGERSIETSDSSALSRPGALDLIHVHRLSRDSRLIGRTPVAGRPQIMELFRRTRRRSLSRACWQRKSEASNRRPAIRGSREKR
jgi:Asp-tRNA(Asn)/Glu-tRNA(Gln) amidotransferase A subunit family amidase